MTKIFLRISTVIILISMCLILYLTRTNISKNSIIGITGNNDVWRASLNIHLGYNNELVIRPAIDEFEPPSEISIDILVQDKSIYTDKLKIIKNDKTSKFGIYKCSFDSNRYLEKNYKDVYVIVSFNNENSKVPLTLISYP